MALCLWVPQLRASSIKLVSQFFTDKTNFWLQAAYNFATAFKIDPRNGQISVNEPLSYTSAAVIILTVKVTDKNADGDKEQMDTGQWCLGLNGSGFYSRLSKMSLKTQIVDN